MFSFDRQILKSDLQSALIKTDETEICSSGSKIISQQHSSLYKIREAMKKLLS